jgi:hypothetical protein
VGPTRQPHCPDIGAQTMPTTSRPRLPPPFCRPSLRRRATFVPLPLVAIKGAPHRGAPLFLPPPSLHCSCAATNTVVLIVVESPRTARSIPSSTASTPPQAPHRRVLLPQPLGPAGDPCSGMPTSFPHRWSPPPRTSLPMSPPPSPPPPIRFATLTVCSPATPLPTTRPTGFYRQAASADGGESLPCFLVVGQKAIWARLHCRARASASVDPSPLQQYHFVFFLSNYSNSILIKVQTS